MTGPTEVFVVSAVRTAIGSFGGSLKDLPPSALAAAVVREAVARAGVPPDAVGHLSLGTVIMTEPRDIYLSRIVALAAGLAQEVPAFNVNRLCGSGLQAVVCCAQSIVCGDCEVAVGVGVESMSRAGHLLGGARWGIGAGDTVLQDLLSQSLHDPFQRIHMGVTAENVAARYGIDREAMDELALRSHRRAAAAIRAGRFREQILALDIPTRSGVVRFDTDEHVRADASLESLAAMKPVFLRDGGRVTVGNSSGINDGAAAVVLASAQAVRSLGLSPIGRLAGYAHAGVDPALMGIGPIPATRKLLARSGLRVEQLDVVEANEAFAAQACAVNRELGFDPETVNPNGSGISLGHPVGATGAIIATKALHELLRRGGRYALATMCIGGGQGIAALFEAT